MANTRRDSRTRATTGSILEFNSRYFNEPGQFISRANDIYDSSPPETYDLLELSDGRVFERFSRIQFVDGMNVGRVWSIRDITDFRGVENTLRRQSEWLSITLASIGDAVITTDTEGRVAFLNGMAQALTGWSQKEAEGRLLTEVFQIINEETRDRSKTRRRARWRRALSSVWRITRF